MTDQVYRVLTVYDTQDKSSKAMQDIARSANEAAKSTQNLQTLIKTAGGAFLGGRIFSTAKSSLIDYNRSIEDSKLTIAGMLTMFTNSPIEKSFDLAGDSVERFQQMAKSSSLTTKDLVDTASGLYRPLLQAGLKIRDINEMTFGVANAAKAFGMNGGVVSMDIEQAITSNVGMRDRFARNILSQESIGLTADQFNKLDTQKRVEVLKKALTTDAIKGMAKKQGEDTFSGVLSTLQDNFEILGGRIGLPLFKAITEEVKQWNKWLDKNQLKLDQFAKSTAESLVKGFKFVKEVFSFIFSHADTLISVAKAYAAIKVGSMIGGAMGVSAGGGAGAASSFLSWFKKTEATDGFDEDGKYFYNKGTAGRGRQAVGGLSGVAENAGLIGGSLAAGVYVGTMLNESGFGEWLSNTKRVGGEVLNMTDKTTREYAALIQSMDTFRKTINETKHAMAGQKGAASTDAAAHLAALQVSYQNKLDLIQDTQKKFTDRADGDISSKHGSGYMVNALMKSKMFDQKELDAYKSNPMGFMKNLENESSFLRNKSLAATEMANDAYASMGENQKRGLEEKQILQALFAKASEIYGSDDRDKLRVQVIMTPDDIRAALDTVTDESPQAKPPQQNVTINIQQVSAKDPNKWLADMDDMVARRTRARTRAKGAWKSTPH